MNEYVIIYKQDCGAKYSCFDIIASNMEKAREYAVSRYSYLVGEKEENIVKVVKLGRISKKENAGCNADDLRAEFLETYGEEA